MPIEKKSVFREKVVRAHLRDFELPPVPAEVRVRLAHWADLLTSGRAALHKESDILPDFVHDVFDGLLGYSGAAAGAASR